jgi:hypothetical protein
MPTNRHAQIRYTVLDRCFSNFSRYYTYQDLLKEVNKTLLELGTEGIQLRQLQYDIAHMKSSAGYGIELNPNLKLNNKRVFRYKDRNFSLANHPLIQNETEQLETFLTIMSRYKYREDFKWLEELMPRMELAFNLVNGNGAGAISYEENIHLKGKDYLGILFNLIIKKQVIEIQYQPYHKDPEVFIVHPYHLKQFNNRWFLFCYNQKYKDISNYPLDRIISIKETSLNFKPSTVNWSDYFEDIIGVTKPINQSLKTIILRFSKERIFYVLTKPLHGSQRLDKTDPSGCTIKIEVIPNPELYQMLLTFGDDVEVLAPHEIRLNLKNTITKMKKMY